MNHLYRGGRPPVRGPFGGPGGPGMPRGPRPYTARVPGLPARYPREPDLDRRGRGAEVREMARTGLEELRAARLSLGDLWDDESVTDDDYLSFSDDDDFGRESRYRRPYLRRDMQNLPGGMLTASERAAEVARVREARGITVSGHGVGPGRRDIEGRYGPSQHRDSEFDREGPVRGGLFGPQRGPGQFGPGGMRDGRGGLGMRRYPGLSRSDEDALREFLYSSEEEEEGIFRRPPRHGLGRRAPVSPRGNQGGW
ncbi:hypothetical protein MMC30_003510 [Trapelia coarctata]|nr:hypothetical protein [Trapelia coarctata]